MGYGGALIWTGLARNLKREFPDKKIVFVYKTTLRSLLFLNKNSDFIIYKNNKDINLVTIKFWWFFLQIFFNQKNTIVVDLDDKKYHYWTSDTKEKAGRKQDGHHAIAIACKPFNLKNIELKTRLNLTKKEIYHAEEILEKFNLQNKKYICIEPNSKMTFNVNRQWPLERWQKLVDLINQNIIESNKPFKIAQIGVANSPVLNGVINLTGQTTFRELKRILDGSIFVLANEGGIAHLATSGDTPAVIISNPTDPKGLMEYPQNISIGGTYHNCGMKVPCEKCKEIMSSIHPEDIIEKIEKLL